MNNIVNNIKKIFYLAIIDLQKNYSGTILGWIWLIFRPCFKILVYYLAFVIGLKTSKTIYDMPYFFWLVAGIIPWFFINEIFHQGCKSIRQYSFLVTKIKFPIFIIPIFSTLSKFLVHCLLVLILIVLFCIKGYVSLYILQLPLYMFSMLIYFTFLSIMLSTLCTISKDFNNLVKSVSFAFFWLSGVIWEISNLKLEWLKNMLCIFNPVTFFVNGYRNCFVKHIWFWQEPLSLFGFLFVAISMIVFSVFVYKRLEKDIPDIL